MQSHDRTASMPTSAIQTLSATQIRILADDCAALLPHLDADALEGQRLFITGGTGFFGLWLLSALAQLNAQGRHIPTCVLSRDPGRFLDRHPQFRDAPWLRFALGNVRDFESPAGRFDLLIHAATETSAQAHAQPLQMLDDIVMGTRRVIDLAVQTGVRRMLLTSSGAVYGPQPADLILQPEHSLLACNTLLPSSAYGEGKRVMELMGAMAQAQHGIESIVARCYAFAGPGLPLDGHFAIGNFVRDALLADVIRVQGDGSPIRSYLYGADLAIWLLQLLCKGQADQSYNVGSDEGISVGELAHLVRDVLAPAKPVQVLQQAQASSLQQRNRYLPSIARVREQLGYAPWTGLRQSIARMAQFHQAAN